HKLKELRQNNSQKLAAYDSRATDPFYRMMDTRARLVERADHYQLMAEIPEHERDSVNVSVRGEQVVITGNRRTSDTLEVAPGQTRKSAAFQTYSETFPIFWPVDPRLMTKEYDGDTLVVTIPKKAVPGRETARVKQPERAKAVRPDFPINLPIAKA